MQASVQHYPTEDLNTADTSCPSRTSAKHFDDTPGPCPDKKRSHPCTNVTEPATMVNRPHRIQLTASMHLLTAEGAPRLQACINAVELAIIANSIALDTVLKAACTARVPYSYQ